MNTQTRKNHVLFIVITLAMLAIVSSACSFHTGMVGGVSQVVDITLDEEQLNQAEPTLNINGYDFKGNLAKPAFTIHRHNFWDGLLVDVSRIELHDGYLRFLGTHIQPDGSRVDGSIDLSLGAENGRLVASIIAMDIPGIELNDPIVIEINEDLEADLSPMDFDSHASVYFKEVKVTENALCMKIKVDVRF
jgi:hypothetical protein